MDAKSLYFPYINVPPSLWMIQQLLYLDELGSIVPYEFMYNPDKLNPFMRDLVSSGLVKQIFPANHISYDSQFDEIFIQIVKDQKLDKKSKSWILNKRDPKFIKIHIEKFGDGLKQELENLGLLKEFEYPWYLVEERTGQLLMSYVASIICSDQELGMSPLTNKREYLNPFVNKKFSYRHQESAESIILKSILPVPKKLLNITEIEEFKNSNNSTLINFRSAIIKKVEELAIEKNIEKRQFELNRFIADSKETIDELARKLNERNWGLNFVTLCSLASSVIPAIDAAQIQNPEDLAKAAPGLLGAVTSEYISRRNHNQSIKENKFIYAAYVKNFERGNTLYNKRS